MDSKAREVIDGLTVEAVQAMKRQASSAYSTGFKDGEKHVKSRCHIDASLRIDKLKSELASVRAAHTLLQKRAGASTCTIFDKDTELTKVKRHLQEQRDMMQAWVSLDKQSQRRTNGDAIRQMKVIADLRDAISKNDAVIYDLKAQVTQRNGVAVNLRSSISGYQEIVRELRHKLALEKEKHVPLPPPTRLSDLETTSKIVKLTNDAASLLSKNASLARENAALGMKSSELAIKVEDLEKKVSACRSSADYHVGMSSRRLEIISDARLKVRALEVILSTGRSGGD